MSGGEAPAAVSVQTNDSEEEEEEERCWYPETHKEDFFISQF